jgi:hypothetical protein
VALLGLVGLAALVAGIGMRTVWLPDDQVTSSVDLSDGGPVAITAPGVPEMRDGPVTITATSADGGPVLLARGREADVTAWVEGAQHTIVTGLESKTALETKVVDGEASVPDPSTSPMWLQKETGDGSATLTWDPPIGRWQLLVAGDGTTAAAETLSMTWPSEESTPWAVPLAVAGTVLLLAAAGLGVWWFGPGRRRWSRRSHREAGGASTNGAVTTAGDTDPAPHSLDKHPAHQPAAEPERTP